MLMGNRVYISIKDEKKATTYYMHWNGSLDTWAPIAQALFKNNVKDINQALALFAYCNLKLEDQEEFNLNWIEENGHFLLDLEKQKFSMTSEISAPYKGLNDFLEPFEEVTDFKAAFEEYLQKKILPDYHDKYRKQYWEGFTEEAHRFLSNLILGSM